MGLSLCGLALAGLALAATLLLRERRLTDGARPLLAIDTTFQSENERDWREHVTWLTPGSVLIVTTEAEGDLMTDKLWIGHADQYDLVSLRRRRVDWLTRLVNKQGAWAGPTGFKMSPGGARLFWNNTCYGGRMSYCPETSRLDGTQSRTWHEDDGSPEFWVDDETYAVMMKDRGSERITEVSLHSAVNPNRDVVIPASTARAKRFVEQYRASHPLSEDGTDWQTVHRNDQPLPTDLKVITRLESPQEDATVYHVWTATVPPILAWLHRFLPFVSANPVVSEQLWISKADTHQTVEIGRVPGRLDSYDEIDTRVQQLQWVPDGKAISFVYGGMLYLLPTKNAE